MLSVDIDISANIVHINVAWLVHS